MTLVLLPDTITLDPRLPDGVRTAQYDVHQPIPEQWRDAEVLVAWGNPTDRLAEAARNLHGLRWVQSLAAGPDAVLAAGFDPQVQVTSGRGLHDGPVAEHTLALVLALARRLPDAVRAGQRRQWSTDLGGLQPIPGSDGAGFTSLCGARVLIWGFGSIAARLAPALTLLGAQVAGIASTAGERAGYPVVTAAEAMDLLPRTDVLIDILPATAATRRIIDDGVLRRLPAHAVFVNVGRGSTVDEGALVHALQDGRLAGAALDVTAVEPLPADSPLWDLPNLLLTPHAAGGRPVGADTLLSDNIAAFHRGEPLRNQVRR
ncbi:NAD(P)-dependent oxidoreductase [Cellulomonas sp. NPDC089187]|uniref:NAD(P)-dependent oxidoreductase n=1 Tax=Cellulomonas sp. NPDC089187 TaxID=3154970 RepID=UPI003436CF62